MTVEETGRILSVLKAAYPAHFKAMSTQEKQAVRQIWAVQFSATPEVLVGIAVEKLIATSKFMPAIAEVKEKIAQLYYEAQELLFSENEEQRRFAKELLHLMGNPRAAAGEPGLERFAANHKTLGKGGAKNA